LQPSLYLVAYIDLLGQAAELQSLKTLPHSQEEAQAIFGKLMRMGSIVQKCREAFSDWASSTNTVRDNVLQKMAEEVRQEYRHIGAPGVAHVGFSDCFVLSVRLEGIGQQSPAERARAANGIWMAILGIAGISLLALADGIPLRGGVDIGLGLDIFPNEIYGPAFLSAYDLVSAAESHLPFDIERLQLLAQLPDFKFVEPRLSDLKLVRLA
jgi:hypothetical protein